MRDPVAQSIWESTGNAGDQVLAKDRAWQRADRALRLAAASRQDDGCGLMCWQALRNSRMPA
jgi:hypothetical protein